MSDSSKRTDDAARAAWLYFIAGKTQDEIAASLGVSRQSAQRLVSQATALGLVKVRIDHPISACLSLAERLRAALGLSHCEVVPDLGAGNGAGVAVALADILERRLSETAPQVIGLGTGRTLRAAVEAMPRIDCAQHKIVSLTGNIAPDGSTAFYNVLFTIADKVTAPTYPLPMPVIAASASERAALAGQKTVARTHALARMANLNIVGIGQVGAQAPLVIDGFISEADMAGLIAAGGVGEILGWVYDLAGRLIEGPVNPRVTSAPLGGANGAALTIAGAFGDSKIGAILGAVRGGLIGGLVTDEPTAQALLKAL